MTDIGRRGMSQTDAGASVSQRLHVIMRLRLLADIIASWHTFPYIEARMRHYQSTLRNDMPALASTAMPMK